MNPCKDCIVSPICVNPCYDFPRYLSETLREPYKHTTLGSIYALSKYIREGQLILYDGDTRWRTKYEKTAYKPM